MTPVQQAQLDQFIFSIPELQKKRDTAAFCILVGAICTAAFGSVSDLEFSSLGFTATVATGSLTVISALAFNKLAKELGSQIEERNTIRNEIQAQAQRQKEDETDSILSSKRVQTFLSSGY